MNKKNIDIKKTLLDNGIIIVLFLLVLLTGISPRFGKNLPL